MDNGYISVLNSQLNKNNEIEKNNGYAYYKNISEPGQLNVHLDGVPVDSPYWIVKLVVDAAVSEPEPSAGAAAAGSAAEVSETAASAM